MQRFSFSSPVEKPFDVIVVGGGVSGAAVAHQAAAQGLRVALFERNDFGSATSAVTSKLIHGGLRYLKNYEFALVRQSLRERRILGDIAANLVRPLRFVIPIYQGKLSSRLTLKAGMILYDLLAFDKQRVGDLKNALPSHQSCSTDEIRDLALCLDAKQITGGIAYYDYANVNPDRMTLAFLKTAQRNGAVLANYAVVDSLLRQGDRIVGVKVVDQLSQASAQVHAKYVVNCAGSWVDEIVHGTTKVQSRPRVRSEGVHLITSKLSFQCAVVLQMADGQHLMFLPWRGLTIVGPTDRAYHGHPSDYRPTRESLEELIRNINSHIPAEKMGGPFTRDDVVFHYGGLRPLVDTDPSEGTYSASRRHEIVDHQSRDGLSGLISVEGGKYTTSRGLAEQVLELIGKLSGWNVHRMDTSTMTLEGCVASGYEEFLTELLQRFGHEYRPETIAYYASNYGLEADNLLSLGLQLPDGKHLLTADGEIMAEIDYVLEGELVYTLSDLLLRRTGIGWMGQPPDLWMRKFAAKLGSRFNWSPEAQQQAIQGYIEDTYTLP